MRKIPKLFELIIENDKVLEGVLKLPVTNLKLFREAKQRKQELIWAAEQFVQNQKLTGGNGNLK